VVLKLYSSGSPPFSAHHLLKKLSDRPLCYADTAWTASQTCVWQTQEPKNGLT